MNRNILDHGQEFFTKYADRIVFGTDLASSLTVDEGRIRAGLIFRWLESADTFRVPDEAELLLGPPEDGIIRGLSLPDVALRKIYHDNFTRLVGANPKPLNPAKVAAECDRLASIAEAMSA